MIDAAPTKAMDQLLLEAGAFKLAEPPARVREERENRDARTAEKEQDKASRFTIGWQRDAERPSAVNFGERAGKLA